MASLPDKAPSDPLWPGTVSHRPPVENAALFAARFTNARPRTVARQPPFVRRCRLVGAPDARPRRVAATLTSQNRREARRPRNLTWLDSHAQGWRVSLRF